MPAGWRWLGRFRGDAVSTVSWMRMMEADSVAYSRETVIERGDDYPGRALEYCASRGETPLIWGGRGATDLGLARYVSGAGCDAGVAIPERARCRLEQRL